jgi:L-lactate dehydrogenase complex protein LldG
MSAGREKFLGRVRQALGREGPTPSQAVEAVEARIKAHASNLVPQRAQLAPAAQVELFESMAARVDTTFSHVAEAADVPAAVVDYLTEHNLPPRAVMAPDVRLDAYPWADQPLLELRRGRAEDSDAVGISGAFAGIAESGTLMLLSGPESPSTINLMPDSHIVVLRRSEIVGSYEETWTALRQRLGDQVMPRTVLFVTGPSRTGDINQTLYLGAHGPRRVHIVLLDTERDDGPG